MRRLHPLTGLLRAIAYAVQGLSIPVFFVAMSATVVDIGRLPIVELGAAGLALGAGYGLASYHRFRYGLSEDSFDVHSGVFRYREREIPLERIQNVDVRHQLVHRLLGVAVVRIETAGGRTTEAELSVVSAAEATRLQEAIRIGRDAVRGRPSTTDADPAERPADGSAPSERGPDDEPTPLFSLTPRDLVVFALTEFRPGAVVLPVISYPLVGDVVGDLVVDLARPLGGPESIDPAMTPDQALAVAAVAVPLTVIAGWLLGGALGTLGYYGFRLGRRGGDFVYERGLLSRYSGAIPVEKLQTLTIRESALQRPLGYAGLQLETAGLGAERSQEGSPSAIPLANRDRVWSFAGGLEGFESRPDFDRPPKLARRRYAVRYLLVVGAVLATAFWFSRTTVGFDRWWIPALALLLVPIAAHCKWDNRGHAVGEEHLFLRAGFWRRHTTVVPFDRLQTIHRSRTVFQRRLSLAHLVADTASSTSLFGRTPVAYDLPADVALERHEHLREALQRALGAPSTADRSGT